MSDPDETATLPSALEVEQVILEALQVSRGESEALQQEALNMEADAKAFAASVAVDADRIGRAVQTFEQEIAAWQASHDKASDTPELLENALNLIERVEAFKTGILDENEGSPTTLSPKPAPCAKNKS